MGDPLELRSTYYPLNCDMFQHTFNNLFLELKMFWDYNKKNITSSNYVTTLYKYIMSVCRRRILK